MNISNRFTIPVMFTCLLLALAGCSNTTVKSTTITPTLQGDPNLPENQLLDVGIEIFNPNIEGIKENDISAYPEVRQAEARYIPHKLMETMQATAHWGAVRIVPADTSAVDVVVAGKILRSDGEQMELEIKVSDATGKRWFKRKYEEETSKYAYQKGRNHNLDPFQDIYNRIANDIAIYRNKLKSDKVKEIRTVAELRFAEGFSPEAFSDYFVTDRKGVKRVKRLPADNDPMMERIRQIRERDYLFVDTLQDYYGGFSREMEEPYQEWRRKSYEEVLAYRELKRASYMNAAAGAAAIIAGVLAAGGDNGSTRAAGSAAIVGGGYLIKSAMDRHAESQIHAEALQELGASMGAEIAPQVIELEDRTITLSGTAQNQYQQWRKILSEIYAAEVGDMTTMNQGT